MGGGGKSSSSATTYNNQQYNFSGGSIDLSNLLGNLNYKSAGGTSGNIASYSTTYSTSNKNTSSVDQSGDAGSGGTFDVAASVGVGIGAEGSGGAVDKTSSYDMSKSTNKSSSTGDSSGIPSYVLYAGAGIAGVFLLTRVMGKKGKRR